MWYLPCKFHSHISVGFFGNCVPHHFVVFLNIMLKIWILHFCDREMSGVNLFYMIVAKIVVAQFFVYFIWQQHFVCFNFFTCYCFSVWFWLFALEFFKKFAAFLCVWVFHLFYFTIPFCYLLQSFLPANGLCMYSLHF